MAFDELAQIDWTSSMWYDSDYDDHFIYGILVTSDTECAGIVCYYPLIIRSSCL